MVERVQTGMYKFEFVMLNVDIYLDVFTTCKSVTLKIKTIIKNNYIKK